MAHQQPAPGDARFVQYQVAHLAVHLPHRGAIRRHVVAHLGILARQGGVTVLHVRHVDVHDAVQQGQGLKAVVAAGVIDQGQAQPAPGRIQHRRDDLRHHVAGGDEIDVVAALVLQGEHHVGDFARLHLPSDALLRDVPVLAKHAAQVAPGEEDGARAAPAAQRVLLAVVGAVARHHRPLSGPAHRALAGRQAIHVAVAGAQVAIRQVAPGLAHAALQLAGGERQIGRLEGLAR